MFKTDLMLPGEVIPQWVAEHALVGLRAKFRCPDYRFEIEMTRHVANRDCYPQNKLVTLVCLTNFAPPPALVNAWRGQIR